MAKKIAQTRVTDNPKLLQKTLSDGTVSLYLDYYLGRVDVPDPVTGEMRSKVQRRREFLKLYLYGRPRTVEEREANRQTLELARRIRAEREQEHKADTLGYRIKAETKRTDFLVFFQNYIDTYTKQDKRVLQVALQRFRDFLRDTPRYSALQYGVRPQHLNKEMMTAFADYLKGRSRGSGAATIYARFKKAVCSAEESGLLANNPCKGISIKADKLAITKEILSPDEIGRLVSAPAASSVNLNIRRAFIFSLYTGVRFCDVKALTFGNVDRANRVLRFDQQKTSGHSSGSGVTIPLNDGLLRLIGEPEEGQGRDGLIFPLPSHVSCCEALARWAKRAGIDKRITWHCARHSFAVNLLNNGTNIKVVSSLLGHSSLSMTERYLHVVDGQKEAAINSLPALDF